MNFNKKSLFCTVCGPRPCNPSPEALSKYESIFFKLEFRLAALLWLEKSQRRLILSVVSFR